MLACAFLCACPWPAWTGSSPTDGGAGFAASGDFHFYQAEDGQWLFLGALEVRQIFARPEVGVKILRLLVQVTTPLMAATMIIAASQPQALLQLHQAFPVALGFNK